MAATTNRHWEQDKEATVYIGNLDERVTDALVWELMLQVGRIVNVHLPKDRVTQSHQGYGFVEFISEEDAEYAAKVMNQVRMFGKPIRVNKASADKQKSLEVGAELFVGNLDPMIDEKTLYDTFSRFGSLVSAPKIARDDANLSKGYGFVSFATFEASDEAIANMNGQYMMNREISVQYAFKKDGRGERHGDEAERMLARQAQKHNVSIPVQPLPPQILGNSMTPVQPTPAVPPQAMLPAAAPMPNGMPLTHYGGTNGYQNGTPNVQQRPHSSTPLPPPPHNLPARPPPSQAGYGGPPNLAPPGFPSVGGPGGPPGGPPGGALPMGPPGGFGVPPGAPPMYGGPPPGMPPGMPPGFSPPPGYPRR